jgi:hypothetical protein
MPPGCRHTEEFLAEKWLYKVGPLANFRVPMEVTLGIIYNHLTP